MQRVKEGPVAGADVEHPAWRSQLVEAQRESAAKPPQDGVSGAGEAPAVRSVPTLVGDLQLLLARGGPGRLSGAASALDPPLADRPRKIEPR